MKHWYTGYVLMMAVIITACGTQKKVAVKTVWTFENAAAAQVINDSNLLTAHIGITVYDPADNKYLYNYQGDKYFVPASNVKLFTCYAAMKNLGDSLVGLRYELFKDTLFIQGNADATLLHEDFKDDRLLRLLNATKTKTIVIDDANWKDNGFGRGWAWDDYTDDYMAERSPLPLYGNLATFEFKDGKAEMKPLLDAAFANVNLYKDYSVKRMFNDNKFNYIPALKTPVKLTTPLIMNGAGTTQKIIAGISGKTVYTQSQLTPAGSKSTGRTYNHILKTQPTDSILTPMMHRSDNFFAEQTLLMISNEKLGVMNNERIIDTLLKTDFKGLPQKPKWVDGSGLSRYNLITPQDFVWVLTQMKNNFSWQRITTILATGNEGTLTNYYKDLQGKLFAKTGTLSNQVALSGYLITKQNKTLVFSVLVNNHQTSATNVRRAVEKFLMGVYENN